MYAYWYVGLSFFIFGDTGRGYNISCAFERSTFILSSSKIVETSQFTMMIIVYHRKLD